MYQLYRERPILVLCMVLANIALSVWCLALDPVINNDGVTYLSIAQMMLDGQWRESFNYYSWPFYSMFIAVTSNVFALELESAAYLLNTILVTSLTLAFVCIVGELSNNDRRIVFIAALVVLFFPSITKYRSFIIRDFGYLSCYLWSLYFIFRFSRTSDKKHLIGWLIFTALSCLFRFEGIVFLLIAPYFLIFFTARQLPNRRLILSVLSIAIVACCAAVAFWYINDKYASMIEVAKASGKDVNNAFDLFIASTKQKLGGEELTLWNYLGVIFSNIGDVLYELVRRMSVFYFLFAIYAYLKNIGFNHTRDDHTGSLVKQVWLVYVLGNLGVLIVFSLYNNFLVSRYTMATALTLLLLSPFVINAILRSFANLSVSKRVVGAIAIILLSATSIEGLDVRTKKMHIKAAGLWIKENIPAESRLYSNDRLIIYYAKRSAAINLDDNYSTLQLRSYMKTKHIHNYDYVAISVKQNDVYEDAMRQTLSYIYGLPIKIVEGYGGRDLFVFKVHPDDVKK